MLKRHLVEVGAFGIAAVALYVGTTILGGVLDPTYSQVANAISELTGPDAPNRSLLAALYVAYNLLLLGFGYALYRASSGGTLFKMAVGFFFLGAVSGVGMVTVFRMDTVGTPATTAGTIHLVLAAVGSLLTVATAIVYGVAFRREPVFRRLSNYSWLTAALLIVTGPAAAISIGSPTMGLFERITIGVYLAWVLVVSTYCLLAARTAPVQASAHAPA